MGLAQRRIITEYRETEFPKWKTQIDAAAGFELPIDDMGRTALRECLKQVTFDGSDGHSYKYTTFENGHMLIKHKVHTNVDQEDERAEGWQKLLETNL